MASVHLRNYETLGLITAIPIYATAPALILVGALMCGSIARVRWDDFSEAFPAQDLEGKPLKEIFLHSRSTINREEFEGYKSAVELPRTCRSSSTSMKSDATSCESRDILSSRWPVFMLYWLPAIAIVAVGSLAISSAWRAVVWTVALATMGTACIVNALRCGRVHCYLTGPFFFLMALVALSYGLGILHLGGNGWNLLGLIA